MIRITTLACAILCQFTVLNLPGADADTYHYVEAPAAAALLKEKPKTVVVDVRTGREYQAGHLKGARNVDFYGKTFKEELAKLDREKTYLVHCASGGRSTQSLEAFRELGFKSIYHLEGGYKGWVKAGLPVAKPD